MSSVQLMTAEQLHYQENIIIMFQNIMKKMSPEKVMKKMSPEKVPALNGKVMNGEIVLNEKVMGEINETIEEVNKPRMTSEEKEEITSFRVDISILSGHELIAMDRGGTSDPYVSIMHGKEQLHKTQVKKKTVNPVWNEEAEIFLENLSSPLTFKVFDKDLVSSDDFMGFADFDLATCEIHKYQEVTLHIEDGGDENLIRKQKKKNTLGYIIVRFIISPFSRMEYKELLDEENGNGNLSQSFDQQEQQVEDKYKLANTFYKMKDIGHLSVKVIKAQGLHSADLFGKSDPFAVLEIGNDREQTHTEYNTLAPEWKKVFTFDIHDIHDFLEITVYDEDKEHFWKYEFLGKIMIPLMMINNGEQKWFTLKDKSLRKKAKGDDAQILIEMNLHWNPIRATLQTFLPKQLKHDHNSNTNVKSRSLRENIKNFQRVKAFAAGLDPKLAIRELKSILNWENKVKSAGAFIGFLLGVYFFQPWMITFGLLLPFIGSMMIQNVKGGWNKDLNEEHGEREEKEQKEEQEEEQKELEHFESKV